jgi:hypothetical protein
MTLVEGYIAWLAVTLIGAFFGSFLAGYLKKKGENLATHEDIQRLVEQVQAVTTATQEIESKISGELWDRQKRWELKRDVLFQVTKDLAAIRDALPDLSLVHKRLRAVPDPPPQHLLEDVVKESNRWFAVTRSFTESVMLVDLVCARDLGLALSGFNAFVHQVASDLGKNPNAFDDATTQFLTDLRGKIESIRKELGVK